MQRLRTVKKKERKKRQGSKKRRRIQQKQWNKHKTNVEKQRTTNRSYKWIKK